MFKPKYFLYARKSTEDDDKQVTSIEAQLFELREFASRENLRWLFLTETYILYSESMKGMFKVLSKDFKKIFERRQFSLNHAGTVDYDQYWHMRRKNLSQTKLTDFQRQRAKLISPFLKPGDTIIDLGCGDGNMLLYLKNTIGIKPIGVDVTVQAVDSLRVKDIEILQLDLRQPEQVAKIPTVDYITGFEILEHLPEPEQLIYSLQHKTRKGFIFSFPNSGYYVHRLRLLFGKFPLQWRTHPGEHLRFWTVTDARYWVEDLGLELKALITYEGIPFLRKLIPNLFARGIIIVLNQTKNNL